MCGGNEGRGGGLKIRVGGWRESEKQFISDDRKLRHGEMFYENKPEGIYMLC